MPHSLFSLAASIALLSSNAVEEGDNKTRLREHVEQGSLGVQGLGFRDRGLVRVKGLGF